MQAYPAGDANVWNKGELWMNRLVITACLVAALSVSAARADTTLVVGIAADPTGFDPEAVLNNSSGFVMSTVYDSLVKYKPGTVEPAPGLAESWTVSPDGLTYTFKLRHGVSFQDGTPFNAHTYLQGIDRLVNKNNPNYIYNTGSVEGYIDFTYSGVQSFTAVDDYTVQFRLKEPSAPFISSLAMVWNGVVSPTAVAKYGKDFRSHPVGSGPFVFREWKSRDSITLDANPAYWNGKPEVDHLIFKEYPDPQTALLALKRGDIQILGDVSTQVVPAIQADHSLKLLTQPGLAISGVGLPTDTAPFNNVKVRQALNMAIDRDAIDKVLFKGLAVPMQSPLPASEWSFAVQPPYKYDPAQAKKMLEEAGVQPGQKVELLTYNSGRGYNPAGADLAVAIQGYLKKVGVDADVRKMDIGAYLATIRSGKYPGMFLVGWTGDNGDPDNFLGELFGSKNIPVGNTARYRNSEVDRLVQQALQENDHAKRVALYQQLQKIIWQEAPWIFVNSVEQFRAIRSNVHGFQLNPTQMFFDMEKVSLGQ
jgi:peptide/nickel transport system substrate-binding protein